MAITRWEQLNRMSKQALIDRCLLLEDRVETYVDILHRKIEKSAKDAVKEACSPAPARE